MILVIVHSFSLPNATFPNPVVHGDLNPVRNRTVIVSGN